MFLEMIEVGTWLLCVSLAIDFEKKVTEWVRYTYNNVTVPLMFWNDRNMLIGSQLFWC
jgi:hypothetical protein